MSLLFIACWFHSLAKLKMHTDSTLGCLSIVTTLFGKHMRQFKAQVCDCISAYELNCEVAARARRLAQNSGTSAAAPTGRKPKNLNLFTYKFHALGDYVASIKWFGTTDSYSTQIVSNTVVIWSLSCSNTTDSLNMSIVLQNHLMHVPIRKTLQNSLQLLNADSLNCIMLIKKATSWIYHNLSLFQVKLQKPTITLLLAKRIQCT